MYLFVISMLVALIVIISYILIKPQMSLPYFQWGLRKIPYNQKVIAFRIAGAVMLFFAIITLFFVILSLKISPHSS